MYKDYNVTIRITCEVTIRINDGVSKTDTINIVEKYGLIEAVSDFKCEDESIDAKIIKIIKIN